MIEKDLGARKKSLTSIKGYATVVHRRWPKEQERHKANKAHGKSQMAKTQGPEHQLGDTDQFPDGDFDLPGMEEIFRRIPS